MRFVPCKYCERPVLMMLVYECKVFPDTRKRKRGGDKTIIGQVRANCCGRCVRTGFVPYHLNVREETSA